MVFTGDINANNSNSEKIDASDLNRSVYVFVFTTVQVEVY
jgi:hypothetical protein